MALAERVDRDANHALRARFDEVYGQYRRLRSGMDDLRSALTELRVTERSDDGQVTATVGARGELISVELAGEVYHDRDHHALGRKITTTIRRACARAATATQELVSAHLPAGSPSVEFLRTGDVDTLFGRADTVLRREDERHG
ncbi:YbaB/EbfC family nucleoid-associated protein [Micromonospora sp. WMMD987]|uniref:YbaB/EbfC family nucleoid-associated protein n=1 Tax=Micromonospora sp. WMMD987 TaxID=3016089 RepID=UPI00249AE063|nr:YbaB/EbfC family nucleoid-associated protein [Micromonospora sp. WMMD987]WFE96455.1 YbaB/EbfC family nucleoid-associated protein [Micromonospora sp. WMMD987]